MALVPSGRVRLMVAQTMGQNDPQQFGVGNSPNGQKPQEREDIQQEQVGAAGQPAAPATPPTASGQQGDTGGTQSKEMAQPSDVDLQPEGDKQETAKHATNLKAYVYQVLEQMGVQRRQLENIDKQIFSQEIDFDHATVTGHYMIPTFTQSGEVDQEKAMNIARQIGQKFGLSQKMKLEGRNWRVSFTSAPKTDIQQGGSSFDELGSAQQKNLAQGRQQQKAAFTIGELIEARRDELVETMRKIAHNRS